MTEIRTFRDDLLDIGQIDRGPVVTTLDNRDV
jgi:hypothetical protein